MKDASSSLFSGFIRVHMNLARPITISLSRRPHHYATDTTQPGAADDADDEDSPDETLKCLSFYLPHGTSKVIHVGRYSFCPSEYMFFTVTCGEKIAKKLLFKNCLQSRTKGR